MRCSTSCVSGRHVVECQSQGNFGQVTLAAIEQFKCRSVTTPNRQSLVDRKPHARGVVRLTRMSAGAAISLPMMIPARRCWLRTAQCAATISLGPRSSR